MPASATPRLHCGGVFVVASGKLAHEETTGSKVWINDITLVGGSGTRQEALRAALEHRRADAAP
jgi:hypothetical protein